jgi:hypothetical protein
MQNGPGSTATSTTGPQKPAAAKPLTSAVQSSGLDASMAALVAQLPDDDSMPAPGWEPGALIAQLLGSGAPTARVLAVIPREFYDEVIAGCTAGNHAHRHHVGHDEAAPVIRRVRCGDGRTATYVLDPGGAR